MDCGWGFHLTLDDSRGFVCVPRRSVCKEKKIILFFFSLWQFAIYAALHTHTLTIRNALVIKNQTSCCTSIDSRHNFLQKTKLN